MVLLLDFSTVFIKQPCNITFGGFEETMFCLVLMVLFPFQQAMSSNRWAIGCRVRPRSLLPFSVLIPAAFSSCNCAYCLISPNVEEWLTRCIGPSLDPLCLSKAQIFPQPLPFPHPELFSYFISPENLKHGWLAPERLLDQVYCANLLPK